MEGARPNFCVFKILRKRLLRRLRARRGMSPLALLQAYPLPEPVDRIHFVSFNSFSYISEALAKENALLISVVTRKIFDDYL